jgi:hypothetical protein
MRTIPGDLYHCGDPKTSAIVEDGYGCKYTLCGIDIMDERIDSLAWDKPSHFVADWWGAEDTMPPRCSACQAHPDYPMLLLGEL